MAGPVGAITAKCFSGFKILYQPTGEYYESLIKSCGYELYQIPSQYKMPIDGMDFNLIISQSRIHQLPNLVELGRKLHLPILSIEHDIINQQEHIDKVQLPTTFNVFSSNASLQSWGLNFSQCKTIYESIDVDTAIPKLDKTIQILFKNHENVSPLGAEIAEYVNSKKLLTPLGDDENMQFAQAKIYLNLNPRGSLEKVLKAMLNGCVVISVDSPLVKETIISGYSGYVCQSRDEFISNIELILNNEDMRNKVVSKANKSVITKNSLSKFKSDFFQVVDKIYKQVYMGA